MSYEHLGERLRLAREMARLTQTEAAQALGLTSAGLSQYESGKRRVDALTLERLSRLYGVPLRYFFGEEVPQAEWEEALRLASAQMGPESKAGIAHLIEKLHLLEDLYTRTETPLPGRLHPPFAFLPEASFSDEEVAELAEKARWHFGLGLAPLSDLRSLLEALGCKVFAVPLGQNHGQLSGLSFLHPGIGPIVVFNEDQAYSRRTFTMAHELAHRLYHYDRPVVLCRAMETRPMEAFADRFAAHFLIPREALHDRLRDQGTRTVGRPEEVIHLARYFGVSYQAMLRRLREEHRLAGPGQIFEDVRPIALARALGYPALPYEFGVRPLPPEERLPRVFLELAHRAMDAGQLSPRRVAEMLGISDLDLQERLSTDVEEERDESYA